MISVRLVEFSGSGSRSRLPRRKRRGTPDVHLLRDSWTTFTRLCRRKASVKVTTYPTIVEIQSAVSAADQDQIIGAPAGGRRAIASNAISRCQLNKKFRFQPDIHRRWGDTMLTRQYGGSRPSGQWSITFGLPKYVTQLWKIERLFPPSFELGTFRVWG